MGKLSAVGQPNRQTQSSIPSGWRPLNGRPGLRVVVWVQVKVRGRGFALRPTLYACSVCDTQRSYCSSMRLVALYYALGFAFSVFMVLYIYTTTNSSACIAAACELDLQLSN